MPEAGDKDHAFAALKRGYGNHAFTALKRGYANSGEIDARSET